MDNFHSKIQCPECGTDIAINVKQLLMGYKFNCHSCNVSIGLASDSKEVVERTVEKIEQFKKGNSLKR